MAVARSTTAAMRVMIAPSGPKIMGTLTKNVPQKPIIWQILEIKTINSNFN
jgi:hypothetical protein